MFFGILVRGWARCNQADSNRGLKTGSSQASQFQVDEIAVIAGERVKTTSTQHIHTCELTSSWECTPTHSLETVVIFTSGTAEEKTWKLKRRRTRRQRKIQGLRELVANMGEESSLVTRRTTHHCLSLLHPQCYRQFSLVVWLRDVSSAYPPAGQSRQTEWSWHSSCCPSRRFVRCLTHLRVQWRPFNSKRS